MIHKNSIIWLLFHLAVLRWPGSKPRGTSPPDPVHASMPPWNCEPWYQTSPGRGVETRRWVEGQVLLHLGKECREWKRKDMLNKYKQHIHCTSKQKMTWHLPETKQDISVCIYFMSRLRCDQMWCVILYYTMWGHFIVWGSLLVNNYLVIRVGAVSGVTWLGCCPNLWSPCRACPLGRTRSWWVLPRCRSSRWSLPHCRRGFPREERRSPSARAHLHFSHLERGERQAERSQDRAISLRGSGCMSEIRFQWCNKSMNT